MTERITDRFLAFLVWVSFPAFNFFVMRFSFCRRIFVKAALEMYLEKATHKFSSSEEMDSTEAGKLLSAIVAISSALSNLDKEEDAIGLIRELKNEIALLS